MDPQLIDRIYECSFVPELWPKVLHETAQLAESTAASLFVTNPAVTSWTASETGYGITDKFVQEGWFWRGQPVSRLHSRRHAGFLRDIDIQSTDEMAVEPIYRDMWSLYGIGWAVGTVIRSPPRRS